MTNEIEINKAREFVLKTAQPMLESNAENEGVDVNTAMIRQTLEMLQKYGGMKKQLDIVDRHDITNELVRRFSRNVGGNSMLSSSENHLDWLTADRKDNWRYWARYSQYMAQELPVAAVNSIDSSTDDILRQLEDPNPEHREGQWDRRGLVVGHVQSGKTGNYTGLICKAADAGYKIIIVLSGLHNNLRSQTQIRLEEGFLGCSTETGQGKTAIGVGLIDRALEIRPNAGTTRNDNGDFSRQVANSFTILPEERPWLFVVKKNKSVLENLIAWIKTLAEYEDTDLNMKRVAHLPLLVIDDECDHGSVDTKEQGYSGDQEPDPDHDPTTINRLIRQLLHSFTRKAYVGYTATPFANIFIHKDGAASGCGPDLFPNAFITSLGAPSNYVGPNKIFLNDDTESFQALLRPLDDKDPSCWLAANHKNGTRPADRLPNSMKEAILSFIFACAVRKLRGQGTKHSSMLIHVSRFTSVQEIVKNQVAKYVNDLHLRFKNNIDIADTKAQLETDYLERFKVDMTSLFHTIASEDVSHSYDWTDILAVLPTVLEDIEVREINGSAKDALDYENHKRTGLKVIAIGGDKLARGLTLEGLCTSYFVRTTKMYDTLMQMGRWFGYRDGYLDVCRLYLDPELIKWYKHITEAAQELREELEVMAATGGTPLNYGLRVRTHSTMTVTSRAKHRYGLAMKLSFSGNLLQTVLFPTQETIIKRNFSSTEVFLTGLGASSDLNAQHHQVKSETWQGHLWRKVDAHSVISFLDSYTTHDDSYRVRSDMMANFVRHMSIKDELSNWTVALIGIKDNTDSPAVSIAGHPIVQIQRTQKNSEGINSFSIGTLTSPRDQTIDLTENQYNAALAVTQKTSKDESGTLPARPSGPAIRQIMGNGDTELGVDADPKRGLLMLYLIDQKKSGHSELKGDTPIVAWAMSLPNSLSNTRASNEEYIGNTVMCGGFNNGMD